MRPTLDNTSTYVSLDIETTGFATSAEIIQFGAVLVHRGKIRGEFSTLIKASAPLPSKIVELTGITDDALCDAPQLAAVVQGIRRFINSDLPIVAHNGLRFDVPRLNAVFTQHGIDPIDVTSVIDTCGIARVISRNSDVLYDDDVHQLSKSGMSGKIVGLNGLADLCAQYTIDTKGHHNALADAIAAYRVWEHQRRILRERRRHSRGSPRPAHRSRHDLVTLVRNCSRCRLSKWAPHRAIGAGPAAAMIMVVHGAPERPADDTAPLQLATHVEVGFRDAYYTHIARCWPPLITSPEPAGTRLPTEDEISACQPFMADEIDCVQPLVIVAVGETASRALVASPPRTMAEYLSRPSWPCVHDRHIPVVCADPAVQGSAIAAFKQAAVLSELSYADSGSVDHAG